MNRRVFLIVLRVFKSVLLNQVSTELDNTEITDSSTNILLEDVPSLDLKEEGKLVISWVNGTNIKYLEKDIEQSTPSASFLNSTTPNNYDKSYLICLKDLLGAYKETIISYNNYDSTDSSNYESITLQKDLLFCQSSHKEMHHKA